MGKAVSATLFCVEKFHPKNFDLITNYMLQVKGLVFLMFRTPYLAIERFRCHCLQEAEWCGGWRD